MSHLSIKLTDSAIRKALLNDDVSELVGIGSSFILRPHKKRLSATWYLVMYKASSRQRHKIGTWPSLSAERILKAKEELLLSVATNRPPLLNEWVYIGELLHWYLERSSIDRSLSIKRKRNIKSSITKHLIPLLGGEKISEVSPSFIEDELIWPLQGKMVVSTVRQHFVLLKRAFKVAFKQERLTYNPLSDVVFTDFFDCKMKGKPSALLPQHLESLWSHLLEQKTISGRLPGFMLMHGTRIGETRQLRWSYIDWRSKRLVIPEFLTKGKCPEHVIMLTPNAIQWLHEHRELQLSKGYRGVYLFPGEVRATCLNENLANQVIREVSGGLWQSHDLRKLARTMWIQLGVDYWVAERLLNHAMTKLDEVYIHTQAEGQKLSALNLWHDYLHKL
ncbi:tyrosine-type recombinase/integrase [Photobacterium damselae subsp. damselae]|uniref:tyrosine-type recombinase/integrase n=1 Tax=Photobacterium damselae TaxID=38293 RepID=UPI00083AAFD9|nr:tyrosine-type recombinase/integrase [Photobacterium damselae]QSH59304.1 tyrosine-type recombinase/integrase [Photobacterium damselae subsp. damselae]